MIHIDPPFSHHESRLLHLSSGLSAHSLIASTTINFQPYCPFYHHLYGLLLHSPSDYLNTFPQLIYAPFYSFRINRRINLPGYDGMSFTITLSFVVLVIIKSPFDHFNISFQKNNRLNSPGERRSLGQADKRKRCTFRV